MKPLKRIAVTGGAGQISYSLLFRLASGELLGHDQPIALHILEVEAALGALKGVEMELEDCAFPLLKQIHIGSDPFQVFEGVDYAFLVGAKPRSKGMERKDLLMDNAKIFMEQGKALDEVARKSLITLVIGNPCHTNCLIARSFAKRLDPSRFYAMMRLDQNRAAAYLAMEAGASVDEVKNLVVWGNHSATQVPDFFNATIRGHKAVEVLSQKRAWLETEFMEKVQKRGAAILEARGKSSAASAANAALDAMRSLIFPTDSVFSMGLMSEDNSYGVSSGLIFSFPCISQGDGVIEKVSGFEVPPFLKEKLLITEKELQEEKDKVQHLMGKGL